MTLENKITYKVKSNQELFVKLKAEHIHTKKIVN